MGLNQAGVAVPNTQLHPPRREAVFAQLPTGFGLVGSSRQTDIETKLKRQLCRRGVLGRENRRRYACTAGGWPLTQ